MIRTRRQFLKTSALGIAGAALAKTAVPTLGLIFPVARPVPPEGLAMYPTGMKFIVADVGLKTMTPEGYDTVIDRIGPAGEKLARARRERRGADGHVAEFLQGRRLQ